MARNRKLNDAATANVAVSLTLPLSLCRLATLCLVFACSFYLRDRAEERRGRRCPSWGAAVHEWNESGFSAATSQRKHRRFPVVGVGEHESLISKMNGRKQRVKESNLQLWVTQTRKSPSSAVHSVSIILSSTVNLRTKCFPHQQNGQIINRL